MAACDLGDRRRLGPQSAIPKLGMDWSRPSSCTTYPDRLGTVVHGNCS